MSVRMGEGRKGASFRPPAKIHPAIGSTNRLCGCTLYANFVTEVTHFPPDRNHLNANKRRNLFVLQMPPPVKCRQSI